MDFFKKMFFSMTEFLYESMELSCSETPKCPLTINISESCPIYIPSGTCLDLVIETYPCYACFKKFMGGDISRGCMQTDGNFILYGANDDYWSTNTNSYPGAYAMINKERNFVILRNGVLLKSYKMFAECIATFEVTTTLQPTTTTTSTTTSSK